MSQDFLFPKEALPARLRADFAAFWAAYPPRRPNPRALAELAFGKAVRAGADPAALVRAAETYHAEVRKLGIGQDFVVHAATFLRQRRWLDYLRAPAPAAAAPAPAAEPDHALWPALRRYLTAAEFRAWVAPLVILSHAEGDSVLLEAPSAFHRTHVLANHAVLLKQALRVRVMDIVVRGEWQP